MGGPFRRRWFVCPRCQRPREALYVPPDFQWRCRICWDLIYASQRYGERHPLRKKLTPRKRVTMRKEVLRQQRQWARRQSRLSPAGLRHVATRGPSGHPDPTISTSPWRALLFTNTLFVSLKSAYDTRGVGTERAGRNALEGGPGLAARRSRRPCCSACGLTPRQRGRRGIRLSERGGRVIIAAPTR